MKVRICGTPYDIEHRNVIDECSQGIVHGEIDYTKGVIRIKNGLPKEIERQVLLHEIVHGLLFHLGKSEMVGDEEFVQLLTIGLYNSSLDVYLIDEGVGE